MMRERRAAVAAGARRVSILTLAVLLAAGCPPSPPPNTPPLACIHADTSVERGDTVALDGTGSSDADGDALAYAWRFVSKPPGSIAILATDGASATFVADRAGIYVVELVVNDGDADSLPVTCAIEAVPANLLENPGFEDGEATPDGWTPFVPGAASVTFEWTDATAHGGARSVCVEGHGTGIGMWQQSVPVDSGRIYVFTGYVAFENVTPPGHCNLEVVFRDATKAILEFGDLPGHTDTRSFELDFPGRLKVRAPDGAATAEINLCLEGVGAAWFDDVYFAPAALGSISGTVTSGGAALEGARVYLQGDPWGMPCEGVTGASGHYTIAGVPVAFPRYVLIAEKDGYASRAAGRITVADGQSANVDFALAPGTDPPNLRIKFGSLEWAADFTPTAIPDGAVIPEDETGYPEAVRPYLDSDACIQADHPAITERAAALREGLSPESRADTREVAYAVYEWICKNIDHGGVFSGSPGGLDQPYRDVTSGIWQTISGDGWCWGRSFYDWAYRPHELLETQCGICVEHAWLASALLRALNVPARASSGALEFWAQTPAGTGAWILMSTTSGRTSYRERGQLGAGFEEGQPEARFSVLSRPVLHEDWDAAERGLWREVHPSGETYPGTPEGLSQAITDLETFAATGLVPPGLSGPAGTDHHRIHYSDVTINLFNLADQDTLDVRFPLTTDSDFHTGMDAQAYWTNFPTCVTRTWIEEISNPPAVGTERWYHVEVDLACVRAGEIPPIYVSVVMHNEEPPGYPDFVSNQAAFEHQRGVVLDFAHMLDDNGVMFNFQSDWNFLMAAGLYDAGTPETNNKNIVRYLKEDLVFEVDTHAHQTLYNYADVAYLIDALGVAPSHTAGGMIVEPPEASILEQFWAPITGVQFPAYTWEAAILWGGGTANHVNEESLWASGVWKPRDKYHFLEHDDGAPLPNVGHYGSRWQNLDRLIEMQQDGELEAGRIYTCSLFVSQGQLAQSPELIAEFEEAIEERNARGVIRWVGLAEVIDIWHTGYGSQPNVLPFQVGPSL